ncbi:MAG: MarR family transcriptional regulator [Ignavibacteriae bacterium]|nr:MAG: MarR family transcriptional regulator [Ignavibacteriota bacterium]
MGTHYNGSKKEMRALDSYIKLMRAADTISSAVNLSLSKFGLTESQFNVLDALYHLGPLSQKELGFKLLKSGGNITMVIDNLEKNSYVERIRGAEDRRIFFVHLTKKGKKRLENILPVQVKFIANEMHRLSKTEQTELQRLCKRIGIRKQ